MVIGIKHSLSSFIARQKKQSEMLIIIEAVTVLDNKQ
jgi:hypothetical protein